MRIVIAASGMKNEGKRLATGIFVCHTKDVFIYLHARMHRVYALLEGAWVNEFREDGPIGVATINMISRRSVRGCIGSFSTFNGL